MDLDSIDKEIFFYLNRYHSAVLDKIMFESRNLLLWVPLLLLAVYMFFRYRKNKLHPHILLKTIIISVFIILQIILCINILPNVFDPLIQRERPVYDSEISQFSEFDSFNFLKREEFYAAKACTVVAIAFFFISFRETPRWLKISLVLWTILISYNRIYIGAHYPFNVLISYLIGVAIGLLTYRYYRYLKTSVLAI